MTGTERHALYELIDAEVREALAGRKDAREVMRRIVTPRQRHFGPVRHCVYCGARTYGRACPDHRDLIQIETAAVA